MFLGARDLDEIYILWNNEQEGKLTSFVCYVFEV